MKKLKYKKNERLVIGMINESKNAMKRDLVRVLNSGAIDIDAWDFNNAPMVLPKTIITALLKKESESYTGRGTKYEKEIKKNVANIRYFI
jgi:hypothetical protein